MRSGVPMNNYENPTDRQVTAPELKTEDIYEFLHSPNPTVQRLREGPQQLTNNNRTKSAFLLILFVITLLTVAVLVIVGVHYTHFTRSFASNKALEGHGEEVWLLHQNVFFLFWDGEGDCSLAEQFCKARNASLATLEPHNREWVQARTRGRLLWVIYSISDGSASKEIQNFGDFFDASAEDGFNMESYTYDYDPITPCIILNYNPLSIHHIHGRGQGGVCQRKGSPLDFDEF